MPKFEITTQLVRITHTRGGGQRSIGAVFAITTTVDGRTGKAEQFTVFPNTTEDSLNREVDRAVYEVPEGEALMLTLQVQIEETQDAGGANDPGSGSGVLTIEADNLEAEDPFSLTVEITVDITEVLPGDMDEQQIQNLGFDPRPTGRLTLIYQSSIDQQDSCLEVLIEATPEPIVQRSRQVAKQAIELILSVAREQGLTGDQLAYALATAVDESALGNDMTELESEGTDYEGSVSLGNTNPGDGIRYRGRGYAQITGKRSYRYWTQRLHENGDPLAWIYEGKAIAHDQTTLGNPGYLRSDQNLVDTPELATDPEIAARILVMGLKEGGFHRLADLSDFPELAKQYIEKQTNAGVSEPAAAQAADRAVIVSLGNLPSNILSEIVPNDLPQPEVGGETGLSETQRNLLKQRFLEARDLVNQTDSLDNRIEIADIAITYAEVIRRSGSY